MSVKVAIHGPNSSTLSVVNVFHQRQSAQMSPLQNSHAFVSIKLLSRAQHTAFPGLAHPFFSVHNFSPTIIYIVAEAAVAPRSVERARVSAAHHALKRRSMRVLVYAELRAIFAHTNLFAWDAVCACVPPVSSRPPGTPQPT